MFSLARSFAFAFCFFSFSFYFFTPLESKPIKNAKRNQPGIPLLFFTVALTQPQYVNLSASFYRLQIDSISNGINILHVIFLHFFNSSFYIGKKNRSQKEEQVSFLLCLTFLLIVTHTYTYIDAYTHHIFATLSFLWIDKNRMRICMSSVWCKTMVTIVMLSYVHIGS